uniref:TLE_N domain-containing protein n=1 Tax=Bursaphelenchus xylophilus TaxID=6326 RepID=A0A1I7SBJ8_BURXY
MVRGAAYDPDIVRRSIQQSNNSTNMGPTTFFDTIEHIKKEYQQLQQQVHKLRSDAEKKAQEVNMLQKQNQEASMQNQNFQLEAARQAEIARRMQQIIQQYMMHLPQEQQQSLMRGLESATKVTTQVCIIFGIIRSEGLREDGLSSSSPFAFDFYKKGG